jgi:hypothetical protein
VEEEEEIMSAAPVVQKLGLRVGDWVVVRSPEEILATLDSNARLEELPFMPQMLPHCGKKFQVRKRAHKLCDTVFGTGGRQMTDAVFLDDLRCDGAAHGGCELRCTIIWKEAWLRRADANEPEAPPAPLGRLENLVRAGTRLIPSQPPSEPLYVCQGTQLPAATKLLPHWKPGQYIEDYKSGNVALSETVARLGFLVYNEFVAAGLGFGSALRWVYNKVQAVRGGDPYPVRSGHLPVGGPTPAVNLGLKEGDLVRVKTGDEILATCDELLFNRGMGFAPEMMPYCGKTFRVKQRVRKIINEKTGQLVDLKNSCLVLDGAECHGRYSRPLNCPRACPPYWREIWLTRVQEDAASTADAAVKPSSG